MKQLNEYLVINFPKIWRSRIVLIMIFSFLMTLFFWGFIDNFDNEGGGSSYSREENSDQVLFGFPGLLFAFILLMAWMVSQYNFQPKLVKHSFLEIFTGGILNAICIGLILIPFFPLFYLTLDEPYYRRDIMNFYVMMIYFIGVPFIFLSFIIRNYSLTEIMLIFFVGMIYIFLVVMILGTFGFLDDETSAMSFAVFHYVVVLFYVIFKLAKRKHNQFDKWLIFALVFLGPLFSVVFITGFGPAGFLGNMMSTEMETNGWMPCIGGTYILLSLLTWYVSKSLEKPIIIN